MNWWGPYTAVLPFAICGEFIVETQNRAMLAFWTERLRAEGQSA